MPETLERSTARVQDPAPEQDGVLLEGLDGGTPLGFLAGLGVQRVLADASGAYDTPPSLSWRQLDAWRPVVHGPPDLEAVAGLVEADARAWESAPILRFRYLKLQRGGPRLVGALRAPVAVLRHWLADHRAAGDDTTLAYACALMCECATEPLKDAPALHQLAEHDVDAAPDAPLDRAVLQTAFDFTSRNAQFLEQIDSIRAHLDLDTIGTGLCQDSADPDADRSMDWDPGADTPGAIYTGFARGLQPVAEWLAFRGLVCFPLSGEGEVLRTTACSGRRKDGAFTWPLWEVPAGPDTVRSLVAWPELAGLTSDARRALGISAVFRAGLTKKADGKSGMFAPAEPA